MVKTAMKLASGKGQALPTGNDISLAAIAQPPRLSGKSPYSVFVGFMKILLPALAAGLILLVVVWPQLRQQEEGIGSSVGKLTPDQAQNLSMLNPRFDGVDEKNQPYRVTAEAATQISPESHLIDLALPKADITLKDGTWLALTAESGRYDRDGETLNLQGEVNLFHDNGFELRTESVRIDLSNGTAQGSQPVEGQGPSGTLQSEGLEILERGNHIIFTGRTRLVMYPDEQELIQ